MAYLVASPTTIRRIYLLAAATVLAVLSSVIYTRAHPEGAAPAAVPGAQADGTTLLPNGWRLAPAGRQLRVGSLPLNIVLSPDGRYAVVTNNRVNRPSFSVVDIANWTIRAPPRSMPPGSGSRSVPTAPNSIRRGRARSSNTRRC